MKIQFLFLILLLVMGCQERAPAGEGVSADSSFIIGETEPIQLHVVKENSTWHLEAICQTEIDDLTSVEVYSLHGEDRVTSSSKPSEGTATMPCSPDTMLLALKNSLGGIQVDDAVEVGIMVRRASGGYDRQQILIRTLEGWEMGADRQSDG